MIYLILNNTQQYINNNQTTSDKLNIFDKTNDAILQCIPEQNSIPIIFRPKIDNDNTSNIYNDNISSLYNLCYIKKESLNDEISKYQLVLYDFNNEIFETERIQKYLDI